MKRSLPSLIAGTALAVILVLYMITYQVRFNEVAVVRTFGRITEPVPNLMFTVPGDLADALDAGTIPDRIRTEFDRLNAKESQAKQEAYGRTELALSEEAEIAVDEPGERWLLADGGNEYLLELQEAAEDDETQIRVGDNLNRISEDVKTEPGLYWKWPWPIDRVIKYDNRLQMAETKGEETPTRDKRNVIVTTAIGWRIADPYKFNTTHRDLAEAERKLKDLVRNQQKTVLADFDFVNLVSVDEEELRYDEIEEGIFELVVDEARKEYGIQVEHVGIDQLALPSQITENVFSAMKEERKAEAARYTSAGESEANRIKTEAEAIAGTIIAFAQRKADEIKAEGKRRAAEFNTEFQKDEALALFLLQIDYLAELLRDRVTVIIDGNEPPWNLLQETVGADLATPTTQPSADEDVAVLNVRPPGELSP